MNLPNRLSIARIALIPVFVILFFMPWMTTTIFAFLTFVVASITDMLDGKIARKYNLQTQVGSFLDTIADKMLVAVVLISVTVRYVLFSREFTGDINNNFLAWFSAYFIWFMLLICTITIVCREFLISGLKMIAATKKVNIDADKLGRYKMVFQVVSLFVFLMGFCFIYFAPLTAAIHFLIAILCLLAATIITIISAVMYLIKYRHVFKEIPKEQQREQSDNNDTAQPQTHTQEIQQETIDLNTSPKNISEVD